MARCSWLVKTYHHNRIGVAESRSGRPARDGPYACGRWPYIFLRPATGVLSSFFVQFPLQRIIFNVFHYTEQIGFIADYVFIKSTLP